MSTNKNIGINTYKITKLKDHILLKKKKRKQFDEYIGN